MSSYSNFGATLAGLIVEEVSGVPYNDYIQKYIFDPLDMKYSTVVEPLPESFIPNQVVGYTSENGSFIIAHLPSRAAFVLPARVQYQQ